MSSSIALDWLNENELRAYPLKELITRTAASSYKLLDGVILDAQFVYATMPANVALTSIVADSLTVTFNCTGGVSFEVTKAGTFPAYVRLAQGHLLVVGVECLNIPEATHIFTDVYFEPSVVHEFGGEWLGVTSLQFDNSALLTGDLVFLNGYQFGISITDPVISLGCGTDYGIPVACTSFSESPIDCSGIISYINGVGPDGNGVLRFSNFGGTVILDDPENHRIFVGLLMNPTEDICKDIPINPALLNN